MHAREGWVALKITEGADDYRNRRVHHHEDDRGEEREEAVHNDLLRLGVQIAEQCVWVHLGCVDRDDDAEADEKEGDEQRSRDQAATEGGERLEVEAQQPIRQVLVQHVARMRRREGAKPPSFVTAATRRRAAEAPRLRLRDVAPASWVQFKRGVACGLLFKGDKGAENFCDGRAGSDDRARLQQS